MADNVGPTSPIAPTAPARRELDEEERRRREQARRRRREHDQEEAAREKEEGESSPEGPGRQDDEDGPHIDEYV